MTHLGTVLGLFLMLMIGYGCKKVHLLKEEHSQILNKIILNITLPCFLLAHLLGSKFTPNMFVTPLVFYTIIFITLIVSYFICKLFKFNQKLTYAIVLTASFANTGYLGYPIVEALFKGNPQAMPTAVIIDLLGCGLLVYILPPILSKIIIKDEEHKESILKNILDVLKTPIMIVTIFGLIFHNLQLPNFILEPLNRFSGATVPLIMIAIGLKLNPVKGSKYIIPILIVFILKMILQPILMYYGLGAIIHEKYIIDIATIQIGLAPAMILSIYTENYKGDVDFASTVIFICTMLTILTVPLTAIILGI